MLAAEVLPGERRLEQGIIYYTFGRGVHRPPPMLFWTPSSEHSIVFQGLLEEGHLWYSKFHDHTSAQLSSEKEHLQGSYN